MRRTSATSRPPRRPSSRGACGARFADAVLTDAEEAFALGLYGHPVTDAARRRVGELLLIAGGGAQYWYTFIESELAAHRGSHGGLSPEEMRVPLLVWRG